MPSDLRQAFRQLAKTPGFTFTIVVTLALGIGATTAIFTLVQQVMLKSLPVVKPEELYRIGDKIHCCNWGGYTQDGEFSLISWELYKHFRDNTAAFEQLAALQGGNAPLGVRRMGTSQQAETRNGQYVSGNFFQTFGVGPWIGRVLTPEDDREGTQLFGVKFWDPGMLSAAVVLLAIAATAAALIPARRAASLDPMLALRTE
jgi:ABC-type antimicrobial peptide transport system permease subunit